MTEAEWLACTDPARMLDSLRGKVSERKLGLFVCACCRQLLDASSDAPVRGTLLLIEQIAEGLIVARRHSAIRVSAGQAVICCGASDPIGPLVLSSKDGPIRVDPAVLHPLLAAVLERLVCWGPNTWQSQRVVETFTHAGLNPARQAQLLREVVRGLFRPLLFRAAWRIWNQRTVPRIAQAIYDDRAFDRMPILADALEDAGCDHADILNHCRQLGEHVRGCWVVDLLLGKP